MVYHVVGGGHKQHQARLDQLVVTMSAADDDDKTVVTFPGRLAIEARVDKLVKAGRFKELGEMLRAENDVIFNATTWTNGTTTSTPSPVTPLPNGTPGYITSVGCVDGRVSVHVMFKGCDKIMEFPISTGHDPTVLLPHGWICGVDYIHFTGPGATLEEASEAADERTSGPDQVVYAGSRADIEAKLGFMYCLACGKVNRPFRKCAGCKLVSFCDRACQRAKWPEHKAVCKVTSTAAAAEAAAAAKS